MVRNDRSHKDIWKDSLDLQVINKVKDIVVDDVKYKFQGMVDSDPHEIKNIVVNEVEIKSNSTADNRIYNELRGCYHHTEEGGGGTNVVTCNENTYAPC
ncbi:hypothetical protein AHAS_Ahas07G0158900 [Arachis hypogaea]